MQCPCDPLQDAVDVLQDLVIPEPQDLIAVSAQPLIPNGVALALRMLSAINFYDQALFAADKINNVGSDRLLPDEFHSIEGSRTKARPKPLFGNGRVAAKASRGACRCRSCPTHEAALSLAVRASRPERPTIRCGASAPSPRSCGERVGVRGSCHRFDGAQSHHTFSTSGRPSRPCGRKIKVMARIENAATSL
jgi:hypothetical protein